MQLLERFLLLDFRKCNNAFEIYFGNPFQDTNDDTFLFVDLAIPRCYRFLQLFGIILVPILLLYESSKRC